MKTLITIISLFIITSCASTKAQEPQITGHGDFFTYIENWKENSKHYPITKSIVVEYTEHYTAQGVCILSSSKTYPTRVLINKKRWDRNKEGRVELSLKLFDLCYSSKIEHFPEYIVYYH